MKEQFDQFQNSLEKIPKVKPEVSFIINDVAKKIINGQLLNKIEIDALEAILLELQDLDKNMVNLILNLKNKNIFSADESSILIGYFLTVKQIGPESSTIRDAFYNSVINFEEFEKLLKNISIPKNSCIFLLNSYKKILNNKV